MSDSSNSSISNLVLDSITALEAIRQTLEEHGIDPDILKFPEFNIPVGAKLALMYDRKGIWINQAPNKELEAGRDYRIRHLVHDSMWGLEEDA